MNVQLTGNGAKAEALALQEHERNAVGGTKVMIMFFHGNTVLDSRVLHLVMERAEFESIRGNLAQAVQVL